MKSLSAIPRYPFHIYKCPQVCNCHHKLHCGTILQMMSNITDDPHPVLLNITDNFSALSWTLHTCKRSRIGRLLGCFFCSLLMNSPLGINSQWISTINNKIADNISHLKKQHTDTTSAPHFDYTNLKQTYQKLTHCSFFQIEPSLILMIWEIVLIESWPSHNRVQTLKWKPLGKLITSNGQISLEYRTHADCTPDTSE
jgi:hypothetical protein